MDRNAIVTKTQKGEEAIQKRAHDLDRNLRYILILVDGKSTVEQLLDKGSGLQDVESGLQALFDQGFVAVGGASSSAASTSTPTAAGGVGAVKAELIAVANDVLGGDAGKVISKIEAAPDSPEGLLEVVSGCKKMVRLIIDENKAEQLMSRCQLILDKL